MSRTGSLDSPADVADAWLYPSTSSALLSEAMHQFRAATVARLQRRPTTGPQRNASVEYIKDRIADDPSLLPRVPAEAGVLAMDDPSFFDDAEVARGWTTLACELLAQEREQFTLRIASPSPLLLPLSGLALCGPSPDGWELSSKSGRLIVRSGAAVLQVDPASGAVLHAQGHITPYPRQSIAGLQVDQHWDLLTSPLKYLPEPVTVAPVPLGDADSSVISRAARLHRAVQPDLFEQMSLFPVRLVPLHTGPDMVRFSQTLRQLPGVVYANLRDPLELLDLLVHEFAHSRLVILEQSLPLMERGEIPVLAPWRRDTRTTHGLYHGIYVFHQVAQVFTRVFARYSPSDRGVARLAVLWTCIREGLALQESAAPGLTAVGAALMERIAADQDKAFRTITCEHRAAAEWAEDVVAAHLAQAGSDTSEGPWFLTV